MDFGTLYFTIALGWYVVVAVCAALIGLSQLLVVIWRYIDDIPDKGLWFIPEKRRRYWTRTHPERSWSADDRADAIGVVTFIVAMVGGFLWLPALITLMIFAPVWILRGLRRGQKKINAVVELAHRHPDGSSTPADVGRLSLR